MFITYAPFFIGLGKLSLEQAPLIWAHFHNALLFQNLLKDVMELELFLIPSPALKNPSSALTVPFPDKFFVNGSPSKPAPKVPNNIL